MSGSWVWFIVGPVTAWLVACCGTGDCLLATAWSPLSYTQHVAACIYQLTRMLKAWNPAPLVVRDVIAGILSNPLPNTLQYRW
jgi:hypothetical protein